MFSVLYDIALFVVGLVALPKLFWDWLRHRKYRQSLAERFGFNTPPFSFQGKKGVVWIHTISMGETKAVASLFHIIRKAHPEAAIVISNITETGHAEAKRSMPGADAYFFLPLDFSWIIRRVLKRLRPDLLILMESDFWFHLLSEAKMSGAKVLLVNGKVSERSAKRFAMAQFFSKRLFSLFDLMCLQSSAYKERFLQIGVDPSKLHVTGNIKLDHAAGKMKPDEIEAWKRDLGITSEDRVVVIGSTHHPEEEWLLTAFKAVWREEPHLKVLIVPRHPERFPSVAEQIKNLGFDFIAYSQRQHKTGRERVILMDAMGLLLKCYQIAEIGIVGGSFTEKPGGHNVFEPVECGVPTLFGPHMYSQPDLARLVLDAGTAKQVKIDEAAAAVARLLKNKSEQMSMAAACLQLAQEVRGSTARTWENIKPFFTGPRFKD